uniref:Uncharacterized protein n=1 Tax=Acrobeloides nanus TaxID=290746 RepID=A0A914DM07_9BILA
MAKLAVIVILVVVLLCTTMVMPRKIKVDNSELESMTLKRKLNALSAEKSRKNKMEAYKAALETIKQQHNLYQETIDLANRVLLDLAKAVGMMKKDYEVKCEAWSFENEFNIENYHKMISELNFKQRRISEDVDKMKIPLKRGPETKMEEEDQGLVARAETPVQNSVQPAQYSNGSWPGLDIYNQNCASTQPSSYASNNAWFNHSLGENIQNFIQPYENFNSCNSLASSSSFSDINSDYRYDDLDNINIQEPIYYNNC